MITALPPLSWCPLFREGPQYSCVYVYRLSDSKRGERRMKRLLSCRGLLCVYVRERKRQNLSWVSQEERKEELWHQHHRLLMVRHNLEQDKPFIARARVCERVCVNEWPRIREI